MKKIITFTTIMIIIILPKDKKGIGSSLNNIGALYYAQGNYKERFYKNLLSGKTKLESLRATKLSFLKSKNYNAPYYWAAFILYGKKD